MAFKFVILSALLAVASAGVISPITTTTTYSAPAVAVAHKVAYANPAVDAVASTHQNVVRSFGGTVSHYSKAVDTPYSSVRKEDTRISNNVYTPAVAKTVTYAAPAPTAAVYTQHHETVPTVQTHHDQEVAHHEVVHQEVAHHEVAPTTVYTHHEPIPTAAVYTHAAPAVTKTVTYAAPAPVVAKTVTYAAAPAAHVYQQHHDGQATTTYNHGPAASTYSHNAPGVSAYGSSQTVHYSPAEMVSHMSFDGFGTHWGF